MSKIVGGILFTMKNLILALFISIPIILSAQNGGACIYILPGDNSVICEIYGNAGVPSENACQANAASAGALPINCPDYLNGCSAAYIWDGISCFFIGSGSCNASVICENVYLPVELIDFNVSKDVNSNTITWTTASEHNADYYTLIMYSEDMNVYDSYTISAMGTTNDVTNYRFIHHNPNNSVNYYELIQYDIDGEFTNYGYIAVNNNVEELYPIRVTNLVGQDVDKYYHGLVIQHYSDGSTIKSYR